MIPLRFSIQLQKRLDAARAEVSRLESALAVFHELGGSNGAPKARAFDAAAAALTSPTPAINGHGDASAIPSSLQRWRAAQVGALPSKHRKRAPLAVVAALGAGATVDATIIMLRELGYGPAPRMLRAFVKHRYVKRGAADRIALTPAGRAVLASMAAAGIVP